MQQRIILLNKNKTDYGNRNCIDFKRDIYRKQNYIAQNKSVIMPVSLSCANGELFARRVSAKTLPERSRGKYFEAAGKYNQDEYDDFVSGAVMLSRISKGKFSAAVCGLEINWKGDLEAAFYVIREKDGEPQLFRHGRKIDDYSLEKDMVDADNILSNNVLLHESSLSMLSFFLLFCAERDRELIF